MRKWIVLLLVAAPVFATEPNPTAKQRELVEKILVVTRADAAAKTVLDAMFAEFEKSFAGNGDDAVQKRERFKMFRERVASLDIMKDFQETQIRLYSKYFTENELADLLAFYASPSGKKVIEVLPNLMRESMQEGAEKIGSRLAQVAKEVDDDYEKARPWQNTMKDIRSIATAVEAYATDNDGKYPTGDIDAIKKVLSPTYIQNFPEKDMWGRPYAYIASEDRKHYRVASSGADTNFEWDTVRITPIEKDFQTKWSTRLEDDLIYADGEYLQMPIQAKPKSED